MSTETQIKVIEKTQSRVEKWAEFDLEFERLIVGGKCVWNELKVKQLEKLELKRQLVLEELLMNGCLKN